MTTTVNAGRRLAQSKQYTYDLAYEAPLSPELDVSGDRGTPEEGAAAIVALLERRGWI